MFSLLLIKTEILKEASLSSLEEIQAPPCLSQVLSLLDFDSQALCGKKWFLFVWRFGLDLHFLSCDFWRMGDHFVLLVDRLLTESTLEAAIGSRKPPQMGHASASVREPEPELSLQKRNFRDGMPLPRKLVECRICQDEDEDSNMETPCSCCGSLKYAHRKCVQRWCNEKGDTTCEICHQQFKPGYTAPPQLFQYGGIPMNFRGNWEITRQDLHNSRFLTMVATDRDFDYDDYSSSSTRSMMCCRSVAVIVSASAYFHINCFIVVLFPILCAIISFLSYLCAVHGSLGTPPYPSNHN